MKRFDSFALTAAGFLLFGCATIGDVERHPPDTLGLVSIGKAHFPQPPGTRGIPIPGGDFETKQALPEAWKAENPETRVVEQDDAPEGNRYLRMPAESAATAIAPAVSIPGRQPLLVSFWWRAKSDIFIYLHNNAEDVDPRLNSSDKEWYRLPTTDGKWRRIGVYTRTPAPATELTVQIRCRDTQQNGEVSFDDLRLRTATETELAAAWEARESRRASYPIPPRESDGRHLALSIRKLQGKGMPGRPYVIWALGSSFTNFLGNGEDLRQEIRPRFPDAPPIVYRKHVGSGTPFEYIRGWARQFAVHDYPDLILIYTNGDAEALEDMLRTIRRSCTADIITGPLHFWARAENSWPRLTDTAYWDRIRSICAKYQVEFVENRRELASWFASADTGPTDILGDSVHQNEQGRRLINLNFARHFAVPETFSYCPASRERRIRAAWALRDASAVVNAEGEWEITDDNTLRSRQKGASLTCTFTGNRIDLVGRRLPQGGDVRVTLDNAPAEKHPAFAATYVRPDPDNFTPGPTLPCDSAPHTIQLGEHIKPQEWTIRMTSNSGDYELVGTSTGKDGRGNNQKSFTGNSGQITIPPALWRNPQDNREGDRFTFRVYRCTTGTVRFRGADGDGFQKRLAQNLKDQKHTVRLDVVGNGPVEIDSFHIFDPPGVLQDF